ncbi:Uncharacterised protein [Enterobacter cloacae]|nr:Uncharacterised protein [Enterobacter cloacae]
MIENLAVNHDLIRLGFTQHRLQPVTHFRLITHQRHTQSLLHAILLGGRPQLMHILYRRWKLARLTATQLHKRLLHRGKQEFRVAVAVGGNDIDTHHRIRLLQTFRRLEVRTIKMQCLMQHIRCEVGSERERQPQLSGELRAVQA